MEDLIRHSVVGSFRKDLARLSHVVVQLKRGLHIPAQREKKLWRVPLRVAIDAV